jgi:hypothetical protein
MKFIVKLLAQGKILNPKILLLIISIAVFGQFAPDKVSALVELVMQDS